MQLAAARFAVDVAAPGHLQLEICVEFYRLVARVPFAVGEPANHPTIDLFARIWRRAVRSPADEKADAVPCSVDLVPAARFGKYCSCAVWRKVVFGSSHHQPRKGYRNVEEVGHVKTA